MTRDEALQKALKLLKLAESTNVHEAALAAQRAQEIMQRFGITQEIMDAESMAPGETKEKVQRDATPLDTMGNVATWKSYLSNIIAKANGCRAYCMRTSNGTAIIIIGRESDSQTVRYLYSALTREVDRLANEQEKGLGRTYYNNFRLGVVDAIKTKLDEAKRNTHEQMRSEVADNPNALVKVNNAIARRDAIDSEIQAFVKTVFEKTSARTSYVRHDQVARAAGRAAGADLSVGRGRAGLGAGQSKISA